jgi:opacity protein-like surface antigen
VNRDWNDQKGTTTKPIQEDIMKVSNLIKHVITIILISIFLTAVSGVCSAQDWSRKGKGELYVFGQFMGGDTTTGDNFEELSIELDDTIAGGLGYGYNFNDHFNLNFDLFYGQTDVKGAAFDESVSGDTKLIGSDINIDFNILKSRLTPLITGGIGYVHFNGDFEGNNFDETDFSYNIGGGLRWDVTDHLLLKAVYRSLWTKLEDTEESLRFDVIALSVGYMF